MSGCILCLTLQKYSFPPNPYHVLHLWKQISGTSSWVWPMGDAIKRSEGRWKEDGFSITCQVLIWRSLCSSTQDHSPYQAASLPGLGFDQVCHFALPTPQTVTAPECGSFLSALPFLVIAHNSSQFLWNYPFIKVSSVIPRVCPLFPARTLTGF